MGFLSPLLCFGLGCETHCAKLSGTLAASFRQLMLVMEIPSFELASSVLYQSCGWTEGRFSEEINPEKVRVGVNRSNDQL